MTGNRDLADRGLLAGNSGKAVAFCTEYYIHKLLNGLLPWLGNGAFVS